MPIKKVYLEMTNQCNLSCAMCYRHAWDYATDAYDDQMVERIVEDLLTIDSLEEIVLGGIGEPTMHPRFLWVLERLSHLRITLTSNAAYLSPALREGILEHVDRLVVSVDGNEDSYYDIRHVPLALVMETLQWFHEHKGKKKQVWPRLAIQMVLSRKNEKDMIDVVDLAHRVGADKVIFSHLLPVSPGEQEDILYTLYQNDGLKKRFAEVRGYALKKGMATFLPDYRIKTERHCRFLDEHTTMINARGEVVPCYRFSHDGKEIILGRAKQVHKMTWGNIMEQRLQDIYDSPRYRAFRRTVQNNQYPSCLDCDLQEGCDLVRTADVDCYGVAPSCADCLWSRNIVYCV